MTARFGALRAEEGRHSFLTMSDGWRLHRETWEPASRRPRAVVLYLHGTGESTKTVAVRRLAHACLSRGLVLETFDQHGHGESLEKGGRLWRPVGFRGMTYGKIANWDAHAVEVAKAVLDDHKKTAVGFNRSQPGRGVPLHGHRPHR